MSIVLSPLAEAYVHATNGNDAAAFLALFAQDAEVDDGGRRFNGRVEIKEWSDREIFGAAVRLEVLGESIQENDAVLRTKVDGNFDRTGLPDPVIITHRLTIQNDKIIKLTCRLAD
jgi:hypothetical protein